MKKELAEGISLEVSENTPISSLRELEKKYGLGLGMEAMDLVFKADMKNLSQEAGEVRAFHLFKEEKKKSKSLERIRERVYEKKKVRKKRSKKTGPKRKNVNKKWKKGHDKYLVSNFGRIRTKELARDLGRTNVSVLQRVRILGIKKKK